MCGWLVWGRLTRLLRAPNGQRSRQLTTTGCRLDRVFEAPPQQRQLEVGRGGAAAFRLLTYNILANCYACHHASYCPKELLEWDSRRLRILEELQKYDADLVCLQEVERKFYEDDLEAWFLGQGFEGIHFTKKPKVPARVEEGCALFYRTSTFSRISSRKFFFSDEIGFSGGGQFFTAVKEQRDGAILALLKHIATGQNLLACSAHLYWNPKWPDVKVAQAHALCAAVAKFLERQSQPAETPVVLCGDFNSLWRKYDADEYDKIIDGRHLTSGTYELLRVGELDSSHPHHPLRRNHSGRPRGGHIWGLKFSTSGRTFESAYHKVHGCEPLVTNKTDDFEGCLDYIYLSKGHFNVLETLSMPYDSAGLENPKHVVLPPMPNAMFPSDHLALGATVVFC
ncbi:unnamed protein product [Ostreobium quekettii]|uniref:Endonuclease/exonuclease/phosphatase domain-containing protein n=1 Tax=Ostreobium quekettii TaxID=121088 RepID=A0A8S1IMS5_9CHLO|nr:unnamed protein product [Ostreobium quekettii]